MKSDVALAAISGGSAVAGAFIGAAAGHYTTIRSHKLQTRQERFHHRQEIYQQFLDTAHEFIHSASLHTAAKDNVEWTAWFRDFETKMTAVQLFGINDVRTAAMSFKITIEEVFASIPNAEGSSIEEKRMTAYRQHEDEVTAAYDDVIAAMRRDVGKP